MPHNRCAALIKKTLQGWKHRRRFLRLKRALIALQCVCRMLIAKNILKNKKYIFLITRVQSWYRMFKPRRIFKKKVLASIVLSAWMRMFLQKIKFTTMINDIRENNKLSSQLDFLKNQLQQEAEARLIAEKVRGPLHCKQFFLSIFLLYCAC